MSDDILKGLEQEARIIAERMPTTMSQHDMNNVMAKLKKFMANYGYTQTSIAEKLGVSKTLISQILDGKYKANLAKHINAIVSLINNESRQQRHIRRPGYVQTTVAEKIGALINNTIGFSAEEAKIGVIIGDAGHGKSYCLRQYNMTHATTSMYLELDRAMNAKLIFVDICKQLKAEHEGSLPLVSRHLIDALKGRHKIVMLDEASHLTLNQLDLLRQVIVDKCRCPLILSGNPQLHETVRREVPMLDQFVSRMMRVLDLNDIADHGSKEDGGLYSGDDIRKLYQYDGIRLADDAVDVLRRICLSRRGGRLRTCTQIIKALHTSPEAKESGLINAGMIPGAVEKLKLPVQRWLPLAAGGLQINGQETEALSVAAAG